MADLSHISDLCRAQMAAAVELRAAIDAELNTEGPERALARRARTQAETAYRAATKAYDDACDQVDLHPGNSHEQPELFG